MQYLCAYVRTRVCMRAFRAFRSGMGGMLREGEETHPDLTSHTRSSLSQPPLTTSALGWPHPSDAPPG